VKEGNWQRWIREISTQRLPSLISLPKWRMTGERVSGNSLSLDWRLRASWLASPPARRPLRRSGREGMKNGAAVVFAEAFQQ
jgi:hypothetical protein